MKPEYPLLDEAAIKIVAQKVKDNPNFLSDATCPYSDSTKLVFHNKEKERLVNEVDEVSATLNELKEQLKKQGKKQDAGTLDASESNSYFRARMAITEKILELQERILKIGEVQSFYGTVMSIMEEVLEPDQRTEFMEKLNVIIGGTND